MATEKRLIDANALETHFRTTKIIEVFPYWSDLPFATQCELVKYGKKCKEIILSAPTVDAVEVVRCKDCKFARPYERMDGEMGYYCMCGKNSFSYGQNWDRQFNPVKEANNFCSCGERRTDGGRTTV